MPVRTEYQTPRRAYGLIPVPRNPQINQVGENRQRRRRFDDESAEAIANPVGGKFGEDLMQPVEDGCADGIPEPGIHVFVLSFFHSGVRALSVPAWLFA